MLRYFLLLLLTVALAGGQQPGQCIFYDACGWDPDYEDGIGGNQVHYLNCAYDGPPKRATQEQLDILEEVCPHLFTGEEQDLCCSLKQLTDLKVNFVTPQQLIEPTCPTCYYNFRKNFCDMTCSPDQSMFVRANNFVEGPGFELGEVDHTNQTVKMVKDITYFVKEEFAEKTYDSCKNVQFPLLSDTVMAMLCGPWGSTYCSPKRWWDFLGSDDNGYSPFQITYEYGEEEVEASQDGHSYHTAEVLSCKEVAPGYSVGCACVDCEDSCQLDPPVFEHKNTINDWRIAGMDGLVFVMIFVFLGGSMIFILLTCLPSKATCCCPPKFNLINDSIEVFFRWWGAVVARFPLTVLTISVVIAAGLCVGTIKLQVTTDPIELWAAPTSRSRVEKDFFDEQFRPFYRTALVVVKAIENPDLGMSKIPHTDYLGNEKEFSAMFQKKFLKKVLQLQKDIEKITFEFENEFGTGTELYDITAVCNKPLQPFNSNCNINSIWAYWHDQEELLDRVYNITAEQAGELPFNYLDHFLECSSNPTYTPQQDSHTEMEIGCTPKWGGAVNPYYVLGGFIPEGSAFPDRPQYEKSEAIVMQIIIDNYDPKSSKEEDVKGLARAMAWEEKFIEFMKNWVVTEMPPYMDVAFTSERSVEDELDRETYGDIATIAVSYIIMFVYITLALGQYSSLSLRGLMIESKITLGLFGVMIVILSVFASIGIFAVIGVPATLIIFEIIPFLVLAVGVDNIFILVQTYQRDKRRPTETLEDQIARVVGEVAPSMLLSSITESACFFLGALSGMPAVKAFALYAGLALLIDFLLQITAFVALMKLDISRQEAKRFDIFCCFQGSKKDMKEHVSVLYKVFEHFYAPFLLSKFVRPLVIIIFFGFTCLSIAAVPKVEIGLDQELSMPSDSFVLKFFEWMKLYLSVGPPVYFVVNNTAGHLDFSQAEDQNLLCSGLAGCREDSVAGLISSWRQSPEDSWIATPAMNWMDDYLSWIVAEDGLHCCRYFQDSEEFCPWEVEEGCRRCVELEENMTRPSPEEFQKTIHLFLNQNPGEHCPKAGHGAFADSVKHDPFVIDMVNKSVRYEVKSNNMMAFHTILKTSVDYYSALEKARELSDSMTEMINEGREEAERVNVFPYSVFYVFYEQYLTMWEDTLKSLGISVATIFVVTFILMGFDVLCATIILLVILLILVNLLGFMYWFNITLNAVSLTNLVMAVGISVEFCSHITKYFAKFAQADRLENARNAVINMGSSVLSGITLTKFGGIIVLAFANSKIFTIFFFR